MQAICVIGRLPVLYAAYNKSPPLLQLDLLPSSQAAIDNLLILLHPLYPLDLAFTDHDRLPRLSIGLLVHSFTFYHN